MKLVFSWIFSNYKVAISLQANQQPKTPKSNKNSIWLTSNKKAKSNPPRNFKKLSERLCVCFNSKLVIRNKIANNAEIL